MGVRIAEVSENRVILDEMMLVNTCVKRKPVVEEVSTTFSNGNRVLVVKILVGGKVGVIMN